MRMFVQSESQSGAGQMCEARSIGRDGRLNVLHVNSCLVKE
jgi:hypothetical protein